MATSDWITFIVTLLSIAFGSGVVLTKVGALEKDLKEVKKVAHNIELKVGGHGHRLKTLERRIKRLESR